MAGIELPEFLGEMSQDGGPAKVRLAIEKGPGGTEATVSTDAPPAAD